SRPGEAVPGTFLCGRRTGCPGGSRTMRFAACARGGRGSRADRVWLRAPVRDRVRRRDAPSRTGAPPDPRKLSPLSPALRGSIRRSTPAVSASVPELVRDASVAFARSCVACRAALIHGPRLEIRLEQALHIALDIGARHRAPVLSEQFI